MTKYGHFLVSADHEMADERLTAHVNDVIRK